MQVREPSAKKGKVDLDNSVESNEKQDITVNSNRHGELKLSKIAHLENEGMGIDQAILHSIDCCGMYRIYFIYIFIIIIYIIIVLLVNLKI